MKDTTSTSRRNFIKSTGATALGSTFALSALPNITFGQRTEQLKVGIIGCGGRGAGAANQALNADENVVLTAMADVFPDRLNTALEALKEEHEGKVQVPKDKQFVGFDAYKELIASDVDVVLLATPPVFRPAHLEAAINAGKHVFCEKPVAVDAQGVRQVLATAQKAKEKNLALVSGLCWRYHYPKRATFDKVLNGDIGELMTVYNTYNTGALWSKDRQAGWSDMEYKMRNWLYYSWLSGDHITEQAVHSIDMMSWVLGNAVPVRAVGTGGRQRRTEEKYGNIFDHFAIVYEFESGAKGFHFSRQQADCANAYSVEMAGTKGSAIVDVIRRNHEINGASKWTYDGESNNMYQTEHDELFASIRKGTPINDGEWMANSTMIAIMGRMVAYTGQSITWEDALNSGNQLAPNIDDFSMDLQWEDPAIAKPGLTKIG